MSETTMINEAEILSRVIAQEASTLPPDAAKILLFVDFPMEDRDRMEQLVEKAREGTLIPEEQAEIDCYERVGHLLSLLRSKARITLKHASARL